MSVTGAAKAGTIISGIVIHFQKKHYDTRIEKLQGFAKELDSHLATFESYKSEISGFWQDDTGRKLIIEIDKQINQIKTARDRVDNLSTLFEDIKASLDSAQSQVNEKVDVISGIVGGLTGLIE